LGSSNNNATTPSRFGQFLENARAPGSGDQRHAPWREISGFRNILVHNHLSEIDPVAVAAVVEKHLGPLASAVTAMLRNP